MREANLKEFAAGSGSDRSQVCEMPYSTPQDMAVGIVAGTCIAAAAALSAVWIAVPARAQSDINPDHKFVWTENVGWTNWLDADDRRQGVCVDARFLSGYIWAENVGWIIVGGKTGPFANNNGTDFGVNVLPGGDLAGFAWGENIGWINFDTRDKTPNQARYDGLAGRLRGYAWSENAGWVNLDHSTYFVAIAIPGPPTPDPSGLNKTRFISFGVPATATAAVAAAGETALRVKFVALHHVDPPYTGGASVPLTLFEGQAMYVGPPTQYVESASSGIPLYASQLQCAPHYQDWSTVGLLHVTGEAITPSSTYNVENLAASCAGNESSCTAVSAALEIKTTRWGDVETPYYDPLHPEVKQPDTSDISALVNKFKSALGSPIKARAFLAGSTTRGTFTHDDIAADVGFTHISMCVDAFKGLPYPYKPGKCAGNEFKACISDSDCTASPTPTTGPCILCP